MGLQAQQQWWKTATIYQIYPKSFCDSGSQGIGDIKGITSKLDYLQNLGVDAIWLTPIYASPMIDNGYDISDYYAINPDFGSMADFDELLAQAHQRGIRLVMDIVVNHTSTEHQWFQSALGDKNSSYRDYYIWKPKQDGSLPNNWQSKFGGPAWKLDEKTNEYFLHLFAQEQADLNWENPAVREEVKQVIEFWAKKGVDGFRLDVINLISKQQTFLDDDEGDGRRFYTDGPRVHEYLQEISEAVFQKYGSVTVGEMSSTTLEHCQQYSAQDGKELSMVFNFHHLKVDYPNGEKWSLAPFDFIELKRIFNHWQTGLNGCGWGALFWCNHDQPRVVSRLGDDARYRNESAKMLAASIHLMQGTPYVYQGEEIGMTNPGFHELSEYRDVETLTMYRVMEQAGQYSHDEIMSILQQKSRDNSRTPMQWDESAQAGFTAGEPWIGVASNYPQINAAAAIADKQSIFYFYKDLIALRKQLKVITDGGYVDLYPTHAQVHGYVRENQDSHLLCLNNYYAQETSVTLPEQYISQSGKVVVGNYPHSDAEIVLGGKITLKPYQTMAILLAK
ncbi:alpha,alpha-phosphotrehalase [Vibrio methylphosphonaticus]|uniref:alpha,alpha-phosphotrehalase n=1 Tax=Vibrio methylphosphonaticus TaxID=2946866 RepID=UPI00202A4B63|nr:alpha,alpha-phosphotrehalase [Vibrio methylphosphonaticus]MCL9773260.1 alpha,alpha-phosphotrehalase [Vibrio methylphosphonaticus]